jgi:hypothetical protein
MKYKNETREVEFDKEELEAVTEKLTKAYEDEYGEKPTQMLVDNFTIWDFIGAGILNEDAGGYDDMPVTVAIMDKAQILVTNDEDIQTIKKLHEEGRET